MTECFCFLFGLIIGVGAVMFAQRLTMKQSGSRMAYLRMLHDAWPSDYHSVCESPYVEWKHEQETLNTPD